MSEQVTTNISCYTLSSLNVGDEVQIEHSHKYEYGYYSCWVKRDYRYLGFQDGVYHFENTNHKHERFRMKHAVELAHRLVGKHA